MPAKARVWKSVALRVFLGSIAFAALASVLAILFDGWSFKEPVLLSALVFAIHSLVALVGAVLRQRPPARGLALAGVLIAVAGALVWLTLIWLDHFDVTGWRVGDRIARGAGSFSTVGAALTTHALARWPASHKAPVRIVRLAAWIFGYLAAAVLLFALIMDDWSDTGGKIFSICLIFAAGSTVGVFVLDRLLRDDLAHHDDTPLGGSVQVALVCPRCAESAVVHANTKSACAGCGLRLRVEFEEPRCLCGYLLHGLTSRTCPECGRSIEPQGAWAGATESIAARSASDDPDQTRST